jgi:hypothetical protein
MKPERFDKYWVTGYGWEVTIFLPEDFDSVELLGENDEGRIWVAFNNKGVQHILLEQ